MVFYQMRELVGGREESTCKSVRICVQHEEALPLVMDVLRQFEYPNRHNDFIELYLSGLLKQAGASMAEYDFYLSKGSKLEDGKLNFPTSIYFYLEPNRSLSFAIEILKQLEKSMEVVFINVLGELIKLGNED